MKKAIFIILLLFCFASLLYAARSHPYITNPGMLLDGFENVNDWTVSGTGATAENDTSIFEFGNQSIKLNATGGNRVTLLKSGLTLDLSTGDGFPLWFYISDRTKLATITLLITSTTNYSKYFQVDFSAQLPCFTGWNSVVIIKSQFSNINNESWNNTMVRIRLSATPTSGQDVSVNFDDLRFGVEGKPKVIITFDDGSNSQYNKAYPILAGNNQTGVAFVITSFLGGGSYMTLANLQTLQTAGWDISNHTYSHKNLPVVSQEEMEADIDGGYDWLVANGFWASAKFFAYPYNAYNDNVIAKLKERHVLARGGQFQGRHFYLSDWYDWQFLLRGDEVTNTTSVATVQTKIDATISRNGVLILLFHVIVDSNADSSSKYLTADFQAISDYLKTKQDAGELEVITFSDYYNALIDEPFCLEKPAMDFNGDCKVDFADFALFTQSWLECNLEPKSACWE